MRPHDKEFKHLEGEIGRGRALGFGVEIGVAALYPMPPVVRFAFERGPGEESGR